MKTKIKNVFEKIEDFFEDHGETVVEAAMLGFYVVITLGYGNALHLANKQKRLEIKSQK